MRTHQRKTSLHQVHQYCGLISACIGDQMRQWLWLMTLVWGKVSDGLDRKARSLQGRNIYLMALVLLNLIVSHCYIHLEGCHSCLQDDWSEVCLASPALESGAEQEMTTQWHTALLALILWEYFIRSSDATGAVREIFSSFCLAWYIVDDNRDSASFSWVVRAYIIILAYHLLSVIKI